MNLLIIDKDDITRGALCQMLERDGHHAQPSSSGENGLAILKKTHFEAVFLRAGHDPEGGLEILDRIVESFPRLPVVVCTGQGTVKFATDAMQRGAADFTESPLTLERLHPLMARLGRLKQKIPKVEKLPREIKDHSARNPELLDFSAPEMRGIMEVVRRAAKTPASILITGESGTGKSVLARAIHEQSHLAGKPFVTVSCPSLSEALLESELFGHARGSFTGAVTDHWGKVRAAEGGTLFLDEIGDLPLEIQPKLLRLLQEHEYERLGETTVRHAKVRIIAATHCDLKKRMLEGAFREDLYFRMNVIRMHMPPLRERISDLIRLANHYVNHFSKVSGTGTLKLSKSAIERLMEYSWPGNLRELRNAIERAVTLVSGAEVTAEDLPMELAGVIPGGEAWQPGALVSLERLEGLHIRRVLERTKTVSEAARVLGIDQATVYRKRLKFVAQTRMAQESLLVS